MSDFKVGDKVTWQAPDVIGTIVAIHNETAWIWWDGEGEYPEDSRVMLDLLHPAPTTKTITITVETADLYWFIRYAEGNGYGVICRIANAIREART